MTTFPHFLPAGGPGNADETSAQGIRKSVFKCAGGTNMKSENDDHMHRATIIFKDDDHIQSAWEEFKDGKNVMTASLNLARK
jgi:peroxiredoxin